MYQSNDYRIQFCVYKSAKNVSKLNKDIPDRIFSVQLKENKTYFSGTSVVGSPFFDAFSLIQLGSALPYELSHN